MPYEEKLDSILSEIQNMKAEINSLGARMRAMEKVETKTEKTYVPAFIQERKKAVPDTQISKVPEDLQKSVDMEKIFGANYLSKIGMVGVLLGISFFLKYSFDNGWIGPIGRIIIGYLAGAAFLGVGEYYRHKFADWSRVFTGGGLAVLYFSTFAGYDFYSIFSLAGAVIVMSAITLLAGFLAVRYESLVVAIFGIVGGFLTPLLIGRNLDEYHLFRLLYVAVLNVGVLGISYFKRWSVLTFLAFLATTIYSLSSYDSVPVYPMIFFISVYFALFSVCTFFFAKPEQTRDLPEFLKPDRTTHVLFIFSNGLVYFWFLYLLLKPEGSDTLSLIALMMTGLYILQYFTARLLTIDKDGYFSICLISAGLAFAAEAIFLAFDEWHVTVAWSVYAAGLVYAGWYAKNYVVRTLGLCLYFVAFFRLLIETKFKSGFDVTAVLNHQFLLYVLFVALAFGIAFLYKKNESVGKPDEAQISRLMPLFAQIISVFVCSVELWRFAGDGLQEKQTILSVFWSLYAMASIIVGFLLRNKWIRIFGLTLFGLAIVKITFIDLFQLELLYRFIGFILLGSVLIFASYLYQKYSHRLEKLIR